MTKSHFLLEREMHCKLCNDLFVAHYLKDADIGLCRKCLLKPFEVVSVARADLEDYVNGEDLAKITDQDMESIARVIGGAMNGVDSRIFWDTLEIAVKTTVNQKK